MAGGKGSQAPATAAEGLNGIVQAISATMTAPDSGPHLPLLEQLLKATVGAIQGGGKAGGAKPPGPPGAPPGGPPGAGGPPGMPPGGGTNINQLMGQGPAGPSAGADGGASQSGASAEDVRRMIGAQAGTAG
jgi:hypothetical protein